MENIGKNYYWFLKLSVWLGTREKTKGFIFFPHKIKYFYRKVLDTTSVSKIKRITYIDWG